MGTLTMQERDVNAEVVNDDEIAVLFAERLRVAMGAVPQAMVAKQAKISTSAFSRLFQGREPGLFKASRIARALGVSLEWLATGEGTLNSKNASTLEIPLLDGRLHAGVGSTNDLLSNAGRAPIDDTTLTTLGRFGVEGLCWLIAEGDSMEPRISDGAKVLIDTKDVRLREGVFAFRLGDEVRVRRLNRTGLQGVEMISDNPLYGAETLSPDDLEHFEIIGRALGAFNFF